MTRSRLPSSTEQAEQERQRAERAEQEIARLKAQLRAQGIEEG